MPDNAGTDFFKKHIYIKKFSQKQDTGTIKMGMQCGGLNTAFTLNINNIFYIIIL